MTTARQVRHAFLRTLIGSQKAAARHTDLLTVVAARWPALLADATRHPLAAQLDEVERWTPGRAQQRAIAHAGLALDHAADQGRPWRRDEEPALWWWAQLPALGYDLTPVEITHRDALQATHDQCQAEPNLGDDQVDGATDEHSVDEPDEHGVDEDGAHEAAEHEAAEAAEGAAAEDSAVAGQVHAA